MNARTYIKTAAILTLLGTGFSGYLSFEKFFTKTCAFSEPCPLFLGHPACYYGFSLFLIMLITAALGLFRGIKISTAKNIILAVSLIGILFAGQWAVPELHTVIFSGAHVNYALGLPTCIYGFVLFIVIFIISVFGFDPESAILKANK